MDLKTDSLTGDHITNSQQINIQMVNTETGSATGSALIWGCEPTIYHFSLSGFTRKCKDSEIWTCLVRDKSDVYVWTMHINQSMLVIGYDEII